MSVAASHPEAFVVRATGTFSLVDGVREPQLLAEQLPDVLKRPIHVVVDPRQSAANDELQLLYVRGQGPLFARTHVGRSKIMVIPEQPGDELLLPSDHVISRGTVVWWQPVPLGE